MRLEWKTKTKTKNEGHCGMVFMRKTVANVFCITNGTDICFYTLLF